MYYIYILKSVNDSTFYVGYTEDFVKRLTEHNTSPHNTYTSKHRPWELKSVFQVSQDEEMAVKAERFIKKQKSLSFIEKISNLNIVDLPMAKLVRVPHVRD